MNKLALALAALIAAAPGLAGADALADNAAFLAANAKAAGVVSLPAIQYKVLKSGPTDGPHPTRASTIRVKYEGRLLDGKVFNTSQEVSPTDGIATFELGKLIPGWVALLRLMRPGDVWEAYLPPEFAYGHPGKETIPPDALLVFKIELVGLGETPVPKP
ncbi:FKBP-type peptidyl-prolyl cis-trans isomerase [Phenylobacterium aquaticum]|uniref:FKBP-type peptidyl-prolyl cis-trans isomerase n=2 Tax=Phenylobacterium aquaticum TaxID=1763816 RepID=UPI0026EC2B73|nr:FKBP-type peptidyl-prolyl cis-trans isomerase [Phenylobacterium aquaticum]